MVYDDKQFTKRELAEHIRIPHQLGSCAGMEVGDLMRWSRWELDNAHHHLGECVGYLRAVIGEAS